jgi:hypothetical protein
MRAVQMTAQDVQIIQILGRSLAELFERVVDLVGPLAEVGVDLNVEIARSRRH